jgi:hypothetical protein
VEVVNPAAAQDLDNMGHGRVPLGVAASVAVEHGLPVPAAEQPGERLVVPPAVGGDFLAAEHELVPGAGHEAGLVGIRRALDPEDDGGAALRPAVQQGTGTPAQADKVLQVLAHDPAHQLQRADGVTLPGAVRPDQDVQLSEVETRGTNRRIPLDRHGGERTGSHMPHCSRRGAGPPGTPPQIIDLDRRSPRQEREPLRLPQQGDLDGRADLGPTVHSLTEAKTPATLLWSSRRWCRRRNGPGEQGGDLMDTGQ